MSKAGGWVCPREEWVCSEGLGMSKGQGYTLPYDLTHDACDVTYPIPVNRHTPVKTLPYHKRAVTIGAI